jgi:hypothetical protein
MGAAYRGNYRRLQELLRAYSLLREQQEVDAAAGLAVDLSRNNGLMSTIKRFLHTQRVGAADGDEILSSAWAALDRARQLIARRQPPPPPPPPIDDMNSAWTDSDGSEGD